MALDITAAILFGIAAAAVDLLVCYSTDQMAAWPTAVLVFSFVALVGVGIVRFGR